MFDKQSSSRLAWLKARQSGIGSSDAPIIMGVSPYRTILDVYNDKVAVDIVEDKTNQWAKNRGNEMEPRIRVLFERRQKRLYPPRNTAHSEVSHLLASVDGFADDNTICEIKWCALRDWEMSMNLGTIPVKYVPQVQHLLMVTRAKLCYYVCYPYSKENELELEPTRLAVVEVLPDPEYQEQLRKAEDAFWFNHVIARVPPLDEKKRQTLEDKSPMWGSGVQSLSAVAKEWLSLNSEIQMLQERQAACRITLLEAAGKTQFSKMVCGGIKISRQERKGNIDYAAIPQLKGVDLEPYRKESMSYWRFDVEK